MATTIETTKKTKTTTDNQIRALLLETTIQVHRIAGDPDDRKSIIEDLKGKALFTTYFVYLEFLRTIITDLNYVYRSVEKLKPNHNVIRLGDLQRNVGTGSVGYSLRRLKRIDIVIACILDEFNETRVSRQRLMRFLEQVCQEWIEDFSEVQFYGGGRAKVKCLDDLMDSQETYEKLKTCDPFPPTPEFPDCTKEFLNNNKDNVRKCEAEMRQPKFKDKAAPILKVLEKMKNGNEYDFLNKLTPTTRGRWWLGDLLIALETPHYPFIYTNDGLFKALCDALGRKLYDGHMPYKSSSQKASD